ncbi:hypothetical protein F9802_03160 [Bacillus aerolatus]|uniref:GHMP kinase N-terminal domain-containing protein n=1 Tax=Bacillus aerolatus TaxID=2653354 RepID=A0A6I1FPF1_9BACI|nr:hypothetical protein [Bacillus aerolatus]KAB7709121.1 hypothetical protein F9802_03160 [Bacillus aerolatus]
MKKGTGSCFGTFGELAQGEMDGHPFLFTLPVPLKSQAVFVPDRFAGVRSRSSKSKIIRAAELALAKLGKKTGGCLYISSQIPVSKGMASSSADITAAVRAVASSFGTHFTGADISSIAAAIEPTDGVMYEGINALNQKNGELLQSYFRLPELFLIGYDSGGILNTHDYYLMKREYSAAEKAEMQLVYDQMHHGLISGNTADILLAATKSAVINDRFFPKPFFSLFTEIASQFEAGVVVGHSGTVIGLLLDKNDLFLPKKVKEIKRMIQLETGWTPIITGTILDGEK